MAAEETGITVVRGQPDAVELASVTAVLLAVLRAARHRPAEAPRSGGYADWTVRRPVRAGAAGRRAELPGGRR
ncbi:hypothetical protein GL263_01215 [Streptomyces durbertensis]|uniref:Acyl-CoA carboxylase subunit epsilon n=2 Tax=Streptomyces durbertensis TaxID=2448886 RepID=A0ABR6ECH1_9ACTN|nr:hypothetical protein [Streptomyces durbertensis]